MEFKKGDAVCYTDNPNVCIGYIDGECPLGFNMEREYYVLLSNDWVKHFSINGICPNTLSIPESRIMLYKEK